MMNKLKKLIKKLKMEQTWCPYCEEEYSHEEDCILVGLWFDDEIDFDEEVFQNNWNEELEEEED